jgi:single-stranded-DNA-specific exonuclease
MPRISARTFSDDAAEALAASGLPPLLARIYAARGVNHPAQLETDTSRLLPFTALKNAEPMASILADAIAARKRLLIVADYDCDGATACAMGLRGLKMFGAIVDYIVPNRFEYGYGLTPEIVRLAAASNPDMLITVDNGIASVEGVEEAKRLNMEVLVTDHHLPGDNLPDARCIVNPNQPGCAFPSKNLAGVGVMFYVLLALRAELRKRGAFAGTPEPNLANLLDLVALGTVADVVKLDENNRILVQQGLMRIRAGRGCEGVKALLQVAKRDVSKATTYELGFVAGPRLNAAGRLEDMSLGIECLTTDDPVAAMGMAIRLDTLNRERRGIEADMQEAAEAVLDEVNPEEGYSISLFDSAWHQGVIGILASRLKDRYHRPVIAFADAGGDELKGSGRSIAGLHLRDALDLVSKRYPYLLQKFGGHAMAAGLTIRTEDFEEFQRAFEAVAQALLTPADLVKIIETDGELAPHEFSEALAAQLESGVWGQGFPAPLFEGEFTVQSQRIVGEKHLKLRLVNGGKTHEAMRFFNADPVPSRIRAVYKLSRNEYNGAGSLQLIIEHCESVAGGSPQV